jgi:hypothetical protein
MSSSSPPQLTPNKEPGLKGPGFGPPPEGASKVFPLLRQSAGMMEAMKSQTPSTKLQTNLKFQYSMTKTQNRFGISNFGHCDLFDICDLLFGISIPPVFQYSSQSLPANPLNSDLIQRTRFSRTK